MRLQNVKSLIRDLPKGPLDTYRNRASFDWKQLKISVDGEDYVQFQNKLWTFIEQNPLFKKSIRTLSMDEDRRRVNLQVRELYKNGFSAGEIGAWLTDMYKYDSAVPVKLGIMHGMVPVAIFSLGTERHTDYLTKIHENEYTMCFALTEISHGTNVKGMRTTATYDLASKSFILHSPDFQAAKCWAGGLGKVSTHAIVFAQLITPDKVNHGLHTFIVPIRDPKTMLPIPGVTVGDMGEKIELNGVDNGFVMFNNYHIPRENLLNRTADVTQDGKYVTAMKDTNKRLGASLGTLSMGRISITVSSSVYLSLAIVIAIRYSAVRKQFGPSNTEEWPVIEYQAQQARLFPHLATAYSIKLFSFRYYSVMRDFQNDFVIGENRDQLADKGMELHAISSVVKPLCTWMARDAIQDCREACGGHGYLKISRLGQIRALNDASCTYEGENNVLIQQGSNWLLNQWSKKLNGQIILSPYETASFLNDAENILSQRFVHTTVEDTMKPENLLFAYKWLVCYNLKNTFERVESLKKNGLGDFESRNNSQIFYAKTLSLVYGEHLLVKSFIDFLKNENLSKSEHTVLSKLCSLHAASMLERRLADLYAGGYVTTDNRMDILLHDGIILLCKELVNEAVALVDVLAPPDFALNSALGMSDGEVYKHMEERFFEDKENFERPTWWREIVQSKL